MLLNASSLQQQGSQIMINVCLGGYMRVMLCGGAEKFSMGFVFRGKRDV